MKKLRTRSGRVKKRSKKILPVFFIIIAVLGCVAGCLYLFYPEPPLIQVTEASYAVETARKADAPVYAPTQFTQAERLLRRARFEWQLANMDLLYLREYQYPGDLARVAKLHALKAASRSEVSKKSLQQSAVVAATYVRTRIDEFSRKFEGFPVSARMRAKFTRGQMLFFEGEQALKKNDFLNASEKIKTAAVHIDSADAAITENLQGYFTLIPLWERWAKETIEWSRQNGKSAIVIDKVEHACRVYKNGALLAEYDAEFGSQWLGDKRQAGDRSTPEGKYRIINVKTGYTTKYYKALVLNYPNEVDLQQFRIAKKKGQLRSAASIGGNIEIHGGGGRGFNWTEGCIALSNSDMDRLFHLAGVGTPVTIVGSLNHTQQTREIMKKSSTATMDEILKSGVRIN